MRISPAVFRLTLAIGLMVGLFSVSHAQLDLSQPWVAEDDRSYFEAATLDSLLEHIPAGMDFLDGMVVIHRGRIVAERYYNSSSAADIFNVWSVTKSYMSTLIGQAIDQGLMAGTETTLDNFFPNHSGDYLPLVTLGNLLSMTSGYLDHFGYPAWVHASTQELIDMPNEGAPGSFVYNSSACNLLSRALFEETGLTPLEFANLNLFPYLGIENPDWLAGWNGIQDGSASMELNLREMVKLGQLYLQDGMSGEVEVISPEWIAAATSTQSTFYGNDYGYLWWLKENSYSAIGSGGQYVIVVPGRDLVLGVHSGTRTSNSDFSLLLPLIYDQIIPLFDPTVSAVEQIPVAAFTGPKVFPNPFNPSTRIGFNLTAQSRVSLKIHDVAGRLVRVLADGETRPGGEHEYLWDGRDDQGRSVVSGVYLSRLTVGGLSRATRMLLLK